MYWRRRRRRKREEESQCAPVVISLNASGCAYIHGFKKPRTGLPADRRSSLIRAMTLEKIGDAQAMPTQSHRDDQNVHHHHHHEKKKNIESV